MNTKEYIESGILENYVLGNASVQEQKEVECMSAIYPELKKELEKIQASIESYTQIYAQEPPSSLKQRVFEEIENIKQEESKEVVKVDFQKKQTQTKIQAQENKSNGWKYLAAACLIGLIFMTAIWKSDTNMNLGEVNSLKESQERLTEANKGLNDQILDLKESESRKNKMLDIGAEQILLSGTDLSPESVARVFWNQKSRKVLVKIDKLPNCRENKEYQLWAIVDGTPVGVGTFGVSDESERILEMQFEVENPSAFAITSEPDGGSKEPTLSEMYVVGKVVSS